MRTRSLITLCAVAVAGSALAAECPSRPAWPTKGWPERIVDREAKAAALKALEDFAFTLEGADGDRKGLRTDGLVIIKNGFLVYERYGRGFTAANKHLSWSVAKSFSSALTGVAVHKGALSMEDSICKYLTEYQGQDVCRILVKHPISFTSGLRWQEDYEDKSYQTSSVISMLFGVGHRDQLAHLFWGGLEKDPGTRWQYSTGDAELQAAVVKRAVASYGKDAFWTLLFDKLGMQVVLEEDAKGTPLGGSMVFATPRDYAKFGFLYLNDGCWASERLLPNGWVTASVTPTKVFTDNPPAHEDTPAGYSFWLNAAIPSAGRPKPWADVPDDAYAALGHWGQKIIVVPSLDLVIVRVGDDREGSMNNNTLITLAHEVAR